MKRDATGVQISLDVEGRRALVIGGNGEAEDKVARLGDGGARVVVVARELTERLAARVAAGEIEWLARDVEPADYHGVELLLVCERDPALARSVYEAACGLGVMAWCADDPEHSHFAMPALARVGRLRVAISTSGASPLLAGAMRAALERDLGERFAAFVERLGSERERLRRVEPDEARRRARIKEMFDGFALEVQVRYPAWDAEPPPE